MLVWYQSNRLEIIKGRRKNERRKERKEKNSFERAKKNWKEVWLGDCPSGYLSITVEIAESKRSNPV